jgi:hypothetical protein
MRVVVTVSVLAALGIGAYLFASSTQTNGPASTQAQAAEAQAKVELAGTSFDAAATLLEEYRAANGSYEGATLPPAVAVTLVRADATSYCLQAGDGPDVEHQAGPGGSPQPGPC